MALESNLTVQDVADVLMVFSIEVAAAMSPSSAEADARLEQIAGNLLTYSQKMPAGTAQETVATLARQLIQTEYGSQLGR